MYRQTIGTPMGTHSAPQLANLSLFHYGMYMKNRCVTTCALLSGLVIQ